MDGDLGISADIAEMLLQSHQGEINLLPALPAAWSTGSIRGLCARGGFEVDINGKDGKLMGATFHSTWGSGGRVRYGDKTIDLKLGPGANAQLDESLRVIKTQL